MIRLQAAILLGPGHRQPLPIGQRLPEVARLLSGLVVVHLRPPRGPVGGKSRIDEVAHLLAKSRCTQRHLGIPWSLLWDRRSVYRGRRAWHTPSRPQTPIRCRQAKRRSRPPPHRPVPPGVRSRRLAAVPAPRPPRRGTPRRSRKSAEDLEVLRPADHELLLEDEHRRRADPLLPRDCRHLIDHARIGASLQRLAQRSHVQIRARQRLDDLVDGADVARLREVGAEQGAMNRVECFTALLTRPTRLPPATCARSRRCGSIGVAGRPLRSAGKDGRASPCEPPSSGTRARSPQPASRDVARMAPIRPRRRTRAPCDRRARARRSTTVKCSPRHPQPERLGFAELSQFGLTGHRDPPTLRPRSATAGAVGV